MRVMPLRHVATVTNSNVDKVIDDTEIPVRLCNYVDVYKNDFIDADLEFSAGTATKVEIESFGLRMGDVIITKDSEDRLDIGVPAYVRSTADDLVCGYHLSLLRAKHDVMRGDFLFWALQTVQSKAHFSNSAYGITRYGLSLRGIKCLALNCPDLATQKTIADFLDRETDRIDRLIEKKERLVDLLEEKKRSSACRAVTTGLNPDVAMTETGIAWMPIAPAHWSVRRIATVFRESQEMGDHDLPVLSVSINWGISDRELGDEDRHRIVNLIEDRSAYKRVRVGDIVYNMMRAWQGAFGVAAVDGLVSPAYVVARPNTSLHSAYFEYLLRTPMCIEEFRRASKGIADFRQRLYWEHFRQVQIVLPPLEEQCSIANALARQFSSINSLVQRVGSSVERLREYRSALITSAVTGQVDVATWGKQGITDRRLDQIEEEIQA